MPDRMRPHWPVTKDTSTACLLPVLYVDSWSPGKGGKGGDVSSSVPPAVFPLPAHLWGSLPPQVLLSSRKPAAQGGPDSILHCCCCCCCLLRTDSVTAQLTKGRGQQREQAALLLAPHSPCLPEAQGILCLLHLESVLREGEPLTANFPTLAQKHKFTNCHLM